MMKNAEKNILRYTTAMQNVILIIQHIHFPKSKIFRFWKMVHW